MQPLPINVPPSSPAHLSPAAMPARSPSTRAVPPSISLQSPSPASTPQPTPTPQELSESSGPSDSIPPPQEQTPFEELSLSVPRATFTVTRTQLCSIRSGARKASIALPGECELAFPVLFLAQS
ncbi:hypothetical protein PHLGIDRAFT_116265 [Phlebiopsis gigantea 11061_1 CR5-6]|uniref:Uncharacterized protein n=1 Tax=Phlebiopsis gigantea (strain 11061_1 CR5-6) TaxID=745531 RepID=A0A0C3NW65_PHLG1|nr:hypothetical protein PHLGIDRAFT_116265 [Phlebiopsis gigantea 11061_1 CR5-6]